MTLSRHLPDETATQAFAQQLAAALNRLLPSPTGISISFSGQLGAGKTTLIRYLLQTLGISGRIKSPTYALVEAYESAHFPIWHFDFYRLSATEEWEDAGFRDVFASQGLRLVEWPEQLPADLVRYDLHLQLTLASSSDAGVNDGTHLAADAAPARLLQLQAHTNVGRQVLHNLTHD